MIAVYLGIYIISAAGIAAALPYEEHPWYYRWHHADYLTEVREMLYVRWQTDARYFLPSTQCQAMRKIGRISWNEFKYIVHYTAPATPNQIEVFVTTLTTSKTMSHPTANAVIYQTTEACRLLQASSTVDQLVPRRCQDIYEEHCPGATVEIYNHRCRQLLGQIVVPRG
ncbi:hypothetical protein V5799_027439 [Amblyomma americanum]|uniref:Uncharacterized protein n=1 Tax=Amblyomma americanum TaxID=6943 RepID=A0AAQ4DFQ4_AMBAM